MLWSPCICQAHIFGKVKFDPADTDYVRPVRLNKLFLAWWWRQPVNKTRFTPAYVHQTQYRSEGTRSKKRAGDERDSATKRKDWREGSLPGPARYPPAFSTVHTDQEPGKGYLHVLDTATVLRCWKTRGHYQLGEHGNNCKGKIPSFTAAQKTVDWSHGKERKRTKTGNKRA